MDLGFGGKDQMYLLAMPDKTEVAMAIDLGRLSSLDNFAFLSTSWEHVPRGPPFIHIYSRLLVYCT